MKFSAPIHLSLKKLFFFLQPLSGLSSWRYFLKKSPWSKKGNPCYWGSVLKRFSRGLSYLIMDFTEWLFVFYEWYSVPASIMSAYIVQVYGVKSLSLSTYDYFSNTDFNWKLMMFHFWRERWGAEKHLLLDNVSEVEYVYSYSTQHWSLDQGCLFLDLLFACSGAS